MADAELMDSLRIAAQAAADKKAFQIVGFEVSPVVSECLEHVVVGDTVPVGAQFDVRYVRATHRTAHRQHLVTTVAEVLRSARTSRRRCGASSSVQGRDQRVDSESDSGAVEATLECP